MRVRLLFIGALLACLCVAVATGCVAAAPETAPESPSTEFGDPSDPSGSETPSTSPDTPARPEPSRQPTVDERAAQKVAELTLEQKVAQLFIVRPESITGVDVATQAGPATEEALATYPVGGIAYFQQNLIDPDQTRTMLANSQAYAQEAVGLPLFTCVDEEGGTVSRIGGNPGFAIQNVGDMAAVGAAGDTAQAEDVARTIGTYLRDLGFNVDFAPDADICGDPATDVMALRSFGTDPQAVASMVAAQVDGFASAGMLCSAKHFPGIGGVMGDSHEGAIVSEKSLDELRADELVPFEAAIKADVPFIMVGHLSLPNATGTDTPASINPAIVTDLLRTELGYGNLIITDSMGMGAVGDVTPDQVGVAALEAGVDLVLMPADFPAAYEGVLDAVRDGRLTEDRIDESVQRIVKTKLSLEELE